jgi:hypothetical protein
LVLGLDGETLPSRIDYGMVVCHLDLL